MKFIVAAPGSFSHEGLVVFWLSVSSTKSSLNDFQSLSTLLALLLLTTHLTTPTMSSPIVAAAVASPSALAAAASKKFDHANLVFNVDLFLIAFLAFFFLLALPRAAIRFSHRSEWFAGLFLRYVEPKPFRPPTFYAVTDELDLPPSAFSPDSKSPDFEDMDESDNGHADLSRNPSSSSRAHLMRSNTAATARTQASRAEARAHLMRSRSRRHRKLDLPVHMPSWTTMLPSVSWMTRISLRPGLSLGGAIIMVAYFITMCYTLFFMSSPLTQPVRAGWVAVSQFPVVIVLATKNNLVGILIGACYSRVRLK